MGVSIQRRLLPTACFTLGLSRHSRSSPSVPPAATTSLAWLPALICLIEQLSTPTSRTQEVGVAQNIVVAHKANNDAANDDINADDDVNDDDDNANNDADDDDDDHHNDADG